MPKKLLIIAGLDPSGNAGLVRDLEIAHSFPLHTSCVVTALTAQNSKKFLKPQIISPSIFKNQLRVIEPLSQYQAIKIGMLGNEEIVKILIFFLKRQRKIPPIILDPVMESSTGGLLLNYSGRKVLWNKLLPLVSLWTPNLEEASVYFGKEARNPSQMQQAGRYFWETLHVPVLIKGGHLKGQKAQDLYVDSRQKAWFIFPRLHVRAIHELPLRGTGCALSTLIVCFVAVGFPLFEAIREARKVMQEWIRGK